MEEEMVRRSPGRDPGSLPGKRFIAVSEKIKTIENFRCILPPSL